MEKKVSISQGALYWTRVVAFGVVAGVGLQFASAWVNPTQTPPNGNVSGPVTTSAIAQYKAGAIGFGGLVKAYLGIDANNARIINVATPVSGKDGVNKDYVDGIAGGAVGTLVGFCFEPDAKDAINGKCADYEQNHPIIPPAVCERTAYKNNTVTHCACEPGYQLVQLDIPNGFDDYDSGFSCAKQ